MSDQQRIRDRVAVMPDGCWIWLLAPDKDGYGRIKVRRRVRSAHRFSYEAFRGLIPEGRQLDHVFCDQPSCVNPWHVEPKTPRENTLRSEIAPASVNARKTHCKHGHEFTPENTYLQRKGHRVERICRVCGRAKCSRQYYQRKRNVSHA